MLPNFRLLIAATAASLIVLSCGFGVFASFRVSREPLTYLSADAASSQLLASKTAIASIAAAEPFTRHSPGDHSDDENNGSVLAYSGVSPEERPAVAADNSEPAPRLVVDNEVVRAEQPVPDQDAGELTAPPIPSRRAAVSEAAEKALADNVAVSPASGPASLPAVENGTRPESTVDAIRTQAVASASRAPASLPPVVEPAIEQTQGAEQKIVIATAPAYLATAAVRPALSPAAKSASKTTKRRQIAAKHRITRVGARSKASSRVARPKPRTSDWSAVFAQTTFQTAPPQWASTSQWMNSKLAIRRAKGSKSNEDANAAGGLFVSAPGAP